MALVSQILRAKGHKVWAVTPDTSVYDAIQLMADKNIGALLVLEEDQIRGIVTERDYSRKVILKGKSSNTTPVSEIMTSEVICVRTDHSVEDCMPLMSDNRVRHLPVLSSEGALVGIISIGDIVKAIIAEQGSLIDHLEGYITGKAR